MIEDYFRQIEKILATAGIVHSSRVTYDKRSPSLGFIRGDVHFMDGSLLHWREFVDVQQGVDRYMYVYHYQRQDGTLLFRYDNAPHFPALPTFPHHKHESGGASIQAASPPDLHSVLSEIERLVTIPEP